MIVAPRCVVRHRQAVNALEACRMFTCRVLKFFRGVDGIKFAFDRCRQHVAWHDRCASRVFFLGLVGVTRC